VSHKKIEELKTKPAAAETRAQEYGVELEEALMVAATDLEDARAASAEELAYPWDAAESEPPQEKARIQREREGVAQLE
jgi:hypothetical protein